MACYLDIAIEVCLRGLNALQIEKKKHLEKSTEQQKVFTQLKTIIFNFITNSCEILS